MDRRSFLQTAMGSAAALTIPGLLHAGGGKRDAGDSQPADHAYFKAIESAAFPGIFLRLDANGLRAATDSGGGVVTCRRGIGQFEAFNIVTNPDNSISIVSFAFPNVLLRLDGTGLTANRPVGGGIVNCQYNGGPYTGFRLMNQPNGQIRFMSAAFPYTYLRMDPTGVASQDGSIGGIVNAQRNPVPSDLFSSFYIRDVPAETLRSQTADYPFAFTEMYMSVVGGVDSNRIVLSSSGQMQQPDDANNSQGWLVRPVPGLTDQFYIYPSGAFEGIQHCLTASERGDSVSVSTIQPGNLRQQWQFEPLLPSEDRCYRLRVTGGTATSAIYLSSRRDGQGLILVEADSGSGREQWRYVPRSEILPQSLPLWDCQFSVALGDYLKANASRSAIRLFAYEVFVVGDVTWQTDLERMPADIRIDCTHLRLRGSNPTINVSGAAAFIDPDTVINPLDFTSFCPQASQSPARGLRGFDAGRIEINAENLYNDFMTGGIGLFAVGGTGGRGQRGYIGRIGASLGSDGEPGGSGGEGGEGGSGGFILIYADAVFPKALAIGPQVADGGKPGPGGFAGAGGKGAPPKSQGGSPGKAGKDGAPGPSGNSSGPAGAVQFIHTPGPANAARGRWLQDTQPDSLRTRLFDSTRLAANNLTLTGNVQQANTHVEWLFNLATTFGYSDVLEMVQTLRFAIAERGVSTTWLGSLRDQQLLSMRADTLKVEFNRLLALPDENQGVSIITQVVREVARQPLALTGPRLKDMKAIGTASIPATDPDWTDVIRGFLAQIPSGSGQLSLAGLLGDGACDLPDYCTAVRKLTPDDLSTRPSGGGSPARPMVLPGFLLIGAALIAANVGGYAAYKMQQRAREKERQRREEEERRRQEEARRYQEELNKWQRDQTGRDKMDPINLENVDKEVERERGRRARQRQRDDETPVIVGFGNQYIGILDSLEAVEGESDMYVAVFDAFYNVFISNPVLYAVTAALLSKVQSFMIEVKIDGTTARTLSLGNWHVIAVLPSTGSTGTMFAAYSAPLPKISLSSASVDDGRLVLAMIAGPDVSVRLQYAFPLPAALSLALDFIFQGIPVPVLKSKTPLPRKTALVQSDPAQVEALESIGQGSFHTFDDQNQHTVFAFDLGDGPPLNTTAGARTRMTALQTQGMNAVIALSHWDKDHYKAMLKHPVHGACPVIAPAFGIRGPLVTGLARAIASHGAGHLYLAGSWTTNFVVQDPVMAAGSILSRTLQPILDLPNIHIPRNISLDLSERTYTNSNLRWDKNNIETITAYISSAGNGSLRLLLPGDCSFSWISTAHKIALTHIEATHHGSLLSLLVLEGRTGGLAPFNNDIPQCCIAAGTVYYSYGQNNIHGHSAARAHDYYAHAGYTVQVTTVDNSNNGRITIQLREGNAAAIGEISPVRQGLDAAVIR